MFRTRKRRIGRGAGSGWGKTAGRGEKGQRSRSGNWGGSGPGFEGGQFPLYRRIPKRGFSNARFRSTRGIVKLEDLEKMTQRVIGPTELIEAGLIKRGTERIKVLKGGTLKREVIVKVHGFSEGAKKAIEQAGGKAEVIQEAGKKSRQKPRSSAAPGSKAKEQKR